MMPLPSLEAVRQMLQDAGISADDLARAESDGTFPLLAVDRLMVGEPACYTLDDLSAHTGLSVAAIEDMWRSLGFPEPRAGAKSFTEGDLDALRQVGGLLSERPQIAALVLQMSRVIGSSMARIASAQVDVMSSPSTQLGADPADPPSNEQVVASLGILLPLMPRVLEAAWKRHLHVAIQRRLELAGNAHGRPSVVGFADLVGFTALSQQVSEPELATVVALFEALAFDVITTLGGRVVKMIGDEVMFTVDAPVPAAEIALSLSEGTRDAEQLSDVRVGLAFGPVLERESDLFGPTVNLASRITAIAFPGSVVVDEQVRKHLADDPRYTLRSMRPRYLKNIGRAPLWVLRRAAPGETRFAERRKELRDAVKARVELRAST